MIVLEILGHIAFWLVMVLGVAIIPFGIPGTFVIVGNTLIYAVLTKFSTLSWQFVGVLLLISVIAEVLEFFLGAAAAGKFGASKVGMLGAILGGFFGAVWGTSIFPLIGTILGAFVGAFAGAAFFDYLGSRNFQKALRVGYGAFLGAIGGKLSKIAVAIAMVVMVGFKIF